MDTKDESNRRRKDILAEAAGGGRGRATWDALDPARRDAPNAMEAGEVVKKKMMEMGYEGNSEMRRIVIYGRTW